MTGQCIPGCSCKERHWSDRTLFTATFIFAAVVLAITPGPGIAYVVARTVARTLADSRSEGLASCIGK